MPSLSTVKPTILLGFLLPWMWDISSWPLAAPCMDLTKVENIKKRWQEYTEELYKKDLHDPDNHDGVITHLEPDILESEVKWALRSITMKKAGYKQS